MGDRSWGKLTVPDTATIREWFEDWGWDEDDHDSAVGSVTFTDNESSGGGYSEAETLRAEGVPYLWQWDECSGSYEKGLGAFDPYAVRAAEPGTGRVGLCPETACSEDEPVIRVNKDGEPHAGDLATARAYLGIVRRFPDLCRQYIAEHPDEPAQTGD